MKEPKRYYCGNGEGMFEENKNGHWVEYSEHKAIVEALTEQLLQHDIVGRNEQLPTDIEVGKMVSDLANIADNEKER